MKSPLKIDFSFSIGEARKELFFQRTLDILENGAFILGYFFVSKLTIFNALCEY